MKEINTATTCHGRFGKLVISSYGYVCKCLIFKIAYFI